MQIHTFAQGSPEWHAHRATHFNASDAPAMMGCSPYETRSQLIQRLATGITPEVGPELQRVFDEGHRIEALARPLCEETIGEELYPVTGSEGILSASFDGLTMLGDVNFEHKSLNDRLRAAMVEGCTGADLPLDYQVQMEQQHMVSNCERTLFLASKWRGNELVEKRQCWYTSNPDLAEKIRLGWKQLEVDVAAYVPDQAPPTPAVLAEPMRALPSVSVKVEGQITIKENFGAFEVALRDFLEHRFIRQPKSDQDFADLDDQIKALKGAEAALETAEAGWIAQIEPVASAKSRKDMLHKLVRDNRLLAEKLLTSEKDRRRLEIVTNGQAALRNHLASLTERLGKPYMPTIPADFAAAIKGMRSLSSMEDAVSTLLANAKITANAIADKIQVNLGTLRELAADHAFLFADTSTIVPKEPDDLTALVKLRISEHQVAENARLEAEREKIRKEELEAIAKVRAAVAAIRFPDPAPEAAPAPPPAAEAIRTPQPAGEPPVPMPPAPAPAPTSLVAQNNAARAPIASTAQVVRASPAREIVWINTATVGQALGLSVNADLLASLSFPGTKRGGPGVWWDDSKLEAIQTALITHSTQALAAHRAREAVAA